MNLKDLRDSIVNLPLIQNQEDFDKQVSEILSKLEKNKLNKTISYLNGVLNLKYKWAAAYHPMEFTGGTHTTSRGESMNSLIKKYIDSTCEMTDFINFLIDFEKKYINETKIEPNVIHQYEKHPLLLSLKQVIYGLIYQKHFEQFALSHNYLVKASQPFGNVNCYEVVSTEAKNMARKRIIKVEANKYACNCETFIRHGIIFRHMFALSIVNQDKNLDRFNLNSRWLRPNPINASPSENEEYSFNHNLVEKLKGEESKMEIEENKEMEVEEKKEIEEESKEGGNKKKKVVFAKNTKKRGAPPKPKRSKSCTEIKSKKPKNGRKSQRTRGRAQSAAKTQTRAQISKVKPKAKPISKPTKSIFFS